MATSGRRSRNSGDHHGCRCSHRAAPNPATHALFQAAARADLAAEKGLTTSPRSLLTRYLRLESSSRVLLRAAWPLLILRMGHANGDRYRFRAVAAAGAVCDLCLCQSGWRIVRALCPAV